MDSTIANIADVISKMKGDRSKAELPKTAPEEVPVKTEPVNSIVVNHSDFMSDMLKGMIGTSDVKVENSVDMSKILTPVSKVPVEPASSPTTPPVTPVGTIPPVTPEAAITETTPSVTPSTPVVPPTPTNPVTDGVTSVVSPTPAVPVTPPVDIPPVVPATPQS